MMLNTLLTLIVTIQPSVGVSAPQPSPRGRAILASIALPGTGQMMLGSAKRGEALLWLDGTLWAFLVVQLGPRT
jgi:hypothetical protein